MAAGMKRTTSVNIRITDELRGELQRLADSNKRTLSDYVRLILEAVSYTHLTLPTNREV